MTSTPQVKGNHAEEKHRQLPQNALLKKESHLPESQNLISRLETAAEPEGIDGRVPSLTLRKFHLTAKMANSESVDKIPQEKDELGNGTVGEATAKEETNLNRASDLPTKTKSILISH